MFANLYSPGLFAGTGIGTYSKLKGCQRVIEPDLSPLLYKSTSAVAEIDFGIATKFCFKDKGIRINLPNFIFF
jgi:hypothetical protein